jgi:hypothetical protein
VLVLEVKPVLVLVLMLVLVLVLMLVLVLVLVRERQVKPGMASRWPYRSLLPFTRTARLQRWCRGYRCQG